MKASIVYYSATGNTEKMAKHISSSLNHLGYETNLKVVNDATKEDVRNHDLIVLGSPAMGVEEIEEYEFRPFFEDVSEFIKNQDLILFGAYDWGDGEWIRSWEKECTDLGANVIATFKCNEEVSKKSLEHIDKVLKETV